MTYTVNILNDDRTIFTDRLIADTLRDAINQAEAYALLLGASGFSVRDQNGREVVA